MPRKIKPHKMKDIDAIRLKRLRKMFKDKEPILKEIERRLEELKSLNS